jgi:multidrug efflux system membrane fusion protein
MTTLVRDGRRKRFLIWILPLLALVLVGLVTWNLLSKKPPPKGPAPESVKVVQTTRGQMPVLLNELGTVTPLATVTVIPNQAVSGYLTEVPFKEGSFVEKGQLLAQIDPRPYEVQKQLAEATLAKDQAILAQAQADLALYEKLHEQKSIAEQTYTDQKFLVQQDAGTVKEDQATIAQYALDIAYCRITAPVAGRVGLRLVDAGNYVTGSSSSGVAVITSTKPITIEFTVAQNDLGTVLTHFKDAGGKLQVTAYSSDNSAKLGTGELYAFSNQMTTSTGTVTLRATFPNDDEILFPNEFVNVRLLVETLQNAVLVPTSAILTGAPGDYVYLVDDQKQTVSVHKVTLGPSDGKNTVIKDGLKDGDKVVTEGTDRLTDGARIKIAEPNQGKGKDKDQPDAKSQPAPSPQ